MFKFTELKNVYVEITNRCQASCPMCARNVHGGILNPNLSLTDWSLEDYKQVLNQDILSQAEQVVFCGDYGDACLNNSLIDMCRYTVETNPNISIVIQTNGSLRTESWWEELAHTLPKEHTIIFGIDGLADTHSLYRVGTSFEKIIKNATAFIKAGGQAQWQYIVFKHNEHQIADAKRLSEELGFKSFVYFHSNRFVGDFPVLDKKGNVTHILQQSSNSNVKGISIVELDRYYETLKDGNIACRAIKNKDVYVNSHFRVTPCCFFNYLLVKSPSLETYREQGLEAFIPRASIPIAIHTRFVELIDKLGGLDGIDAKKHGLKNIIESEVWQTTFHKEWSERSSAARPCVLECSDKGYAFKEADEM